MDFQENKLIEEMSEKSIFQKIENKEEIEINNDCKNIIINNCRKINLYNINCDFCFISKCKECNILSSNIKSLFINDDVNLTILRFKGEIKKYNYKLKENMENKYFSFHF